MLNNKNNHNANNSNNSNSQSQNNKSTTGNQEWKSKGPNHAYKSLNAAIITYPKKTNDGNNDDSR